MPRGPNISFRQRDLVRALRSARLAGITHARVEIDSKTGKISVILAPPDEAPEKVIPPAPHPA